jgi:starch phosphorylase
VGADNIFIFGLTADQVAEWRHAGYEGHATAAAEPVLARTIESIASGLFSPDDPARFRPLTEAILGRDEFMVAADFAAYARAQDLVEHAWTDSAAWWRKSLLNTSRMGWFSSDRTIREYAEEIWQVPVRPEGA